MIRNNLGHDVDEEILVKEEKKLRQPDCDISDKGTFQAVNLGSYLSGGGFEKTFKSLPSTFVFVSSPMLRCLRTAELITQNLNVTVYVHPDCYEDGGCYDSEHRGK
jgi:broad specificity phosphatase PhoE